MVPEPEVEGAPHEAAECAGRAATRLLPQPAEDAEPRGPHGARGAAGQRALLLLCRWDVLKWLDDWCSTFFFLFLKCSHVEILYCFF